MENVFLVHRLSDGKVLTPFEDMYDARAFVAVQLAASRKDQPQGIFSTNFDQDGKLLVEIWNGYSIMEMEVVTSIEIPKWARKMQERHIGTGTSRNRDKKTLEKLFDNWATYQALDDGDGDGEES